VAAGERPAPRQHDQPVRTSSRDRSGTPDSCFADTAPVTSPAETQETLRPWEIRQENSPPIPKERVAPWVIWAHRRRPTLEATPAPPLLPPESPPESDSARNPTQKAPPTLRSLAK